MATCIACRRSKQAELETFEPKVAAWLRETTPPSQAEVLRRARVAGYRGGKSALYELARRLRREQARA